MPQTEDEKRIDAKISQVFSAIAQGLYSNDMDWNLGWEAWNRMLTLRFSTNEIEYYHERLKTKLRKGSEYEFMVNPDDGDYAIMGTEDGAIDAKCASRGNMLDLDPEKDEVLGRIMIDIQMSEGDTR